MLITLKYVLCRALVKFTFGDHPLMAEVQCALNSLIYCVSSEMSQFIEHSIQGVESMCWRRW